ERCDRRRQDDHRRTVAALYRRRRNSDILAAGIEPDRWTDHYVTGKVRCVDRLHQPRTVGAAGTLEAVSRDQQGFECKSDIEALNRKPEIRTGGLERRF